jgi:hypothetical protein
MCGKTKVNVAKSLSAPENHPGPGSIFCHRIARCSASRASTMVYLALKYYLAFNYMCGFLVIHQIARPWSFSVVPLRKRSRGRSPHCDFHVSIQSFQIDVLEFIFL